MKATYLQSEFSTLVEAISSKISKLQTIKESKMQQINTDNTKIDNLPIYKKVFSTKHDFNVPIWHRTDLVNRVNWISEDIYNLKNILNKIDNCNNAFSITLADEELDLIFV